MVIKKRSEPMGVIKYAVSSKPARLKILQSLNKQDLFQKLISGCCIRLSIGTFFKSTPS